MDDILIASKTFDEQIEHIRDVFDRLCAAGIRLKPKKCVFLREEVPYLGHLISADGVRPDPGKMEKVKIFPIPRMFGNLFASLPTIDVLYQISLIAALLSALTKKNAVFIWSTECHADFDRLKEMLITAPVLAFPSRRVCFGDGCKWSWSGCDALPTTNGRFAASYCLCLMYSGNYGITGLEMLAVVWASQYFRPYLLGHRTVVYTDHSACVSVLSTAAPSEKLARWALTIQELNLVIKHRAGKLNANADALSRNPVKVFGCSCKDDNLSVDVLFEHKAPSISVSVDSDKQQDGVRGAGVDCRVNSDRFRLCRQRS